MSNPIITRLGINQFWYKHWYSDTLFSQNLHQDKSFELLIKFYLDHGCTYQTNPLIHEYWYNANLKKRRVSINIHNINFYRRFFYVNDVLDIEHSYLIRNHTGEYFPMRMWLLKYRNWVILSMQWFKPIKKKSAKTHRRKFGATHVSTVHEMVKFKQTKYLLKRLKLLMMLFLNKFNSSKKEYLF